MFVGCARLGVWADVLVVCVCVGAGGLVICRCVCDLLIYVHCSVAQLRELLLSSIEDSSCEPIRYRYACVSVSGVLFSVGVCACVTC